MKKYIVFIFSYLLVGLSSIDLLAQSNTLEAYAYESGNRGYLYGVEVEVLDAETKQILVSGRTDESGFISLNIPNGKGLVLRSSKSNFDALAINFSTIEKADGEKVFLKIEMERSPGYTFEITLAEKRESEEIPVDAIRGAKIEVYNNTSKETTLSLEDHPHPDFKVDLKKGNHYTILVRKKGFFAKRMEAFVNVEGCILCFEGVGKVEPGVSDNLTEGHEKGVLLANVEMERSFAGKKIELENIYYDLGKWDIRKDAEPELDKVGALIKDNPQLILEVGSHTDARGKRPANLDLSRKRAKSAVDYLVYNHNLDRSKISSKGYGESEILNKCKDGVECSEALHAINRRTELKVVGVIDSEWANIKSLEVIKSQENMDDLIKELQGQKTIKVEEGETIDDALERSKETESVTSHINDSLSSIESKPLKKEEIPKEESSSVFSEAPETSGFTGYKIVIHFTNIPLEPDHQIFSRHKNVLAYKTQEKNILYMVGKFETKDEAESFNKTTISHMYPNAYVVQLENGKRIK